MSPSALLPSSECWIFSFAFSLPHLVSYDVSCERALRSAAPLSAYVYVECRVF